MNATGQRQDAAALELRPAPATGDEIAERVAQLRVRYAPCLRSLPAPLAVRAQRDLSGTWRWKFEVEDFRGGARPEPPDWHRADFDGAAPTFHPRSTRFPTGGGTTSCSTRCSC